MIDLGCAQLLADGGDTGNGVYDFFIGRPLNPRIGALDLKVRWGLDWAVWGRVRCAAVCCSAV